MAGRWNYETGAYDPYELPDGASCYETDMRKKVSCAECGKRVEFGECYTSKRIHTEHGFGYAVCLDCYVDEVRVEAESRGRGE